MSPAQGMVRVVLELAREAGDHVEGVVRTPEGEKRFSGWLDLVAVLERAIDARQTTGG